MQNRSFYRTNPLVLVFFTIYRIILAWIGGRGQEGELEVAQRCQAQHRKLKKKESTNYTNYNEQIRISVEIFVFIRVIR